MNLKIINQYKCIDTIQRIDNIYFNDMDWSMYECVKPENS